MKIWIVSYYDTVHNGQITVTAFYNYEAARKNYEYELGKHRVVSIDEVPIYSRFYIVDRVAHSERGDAK